MQNFSVEELCQKAIEQDKYALSQIISLYENPKAGTLKLKQKLEEYLFMQNQKPRAYIYGWTGSPGVGKSTLLGVLLTEALNQKKDCSFAVLAIDPSSYLSGGAFLGDRTRMRFPVYEKRIFFRSQASNLELGGLGSYTWPVAYILSYFFDYLFIETVGIGQSELEIRYLADEVILILQPFAGDKIQFLKAGIMEIPDIFILNKCDEEKLARESYQALVQSLSFVNEKNPLIFTVSAVTKRGIAELLENLFSKNKKPQQREKAYIYFFEKEIRRLFGELGIYALKEAKFKLNHPPKGFGKDLEEAKDLIKKILVSKALKIWEKI